jgi:uncharacterized protein (TIGR02145 family)
LYDWAAAIQKAGAFVNSTSDVGCSGKAAGTLSTAPGACRGICPDGWHIPTGNTSGEFQDLHNKIGGCSTSNYNCWYAASSWEGNLGGWTYHTTQVLDEQGTTGRYWTSTYADSERGFNLAFTDKVCYPGTANNDKRHGMAVRCVKNYFE